MSGSAVLALRLKRAENIIEAGKKTFVQVGEALKQIRDERLYKEGGYPSFDAYCAERWGMRKSYASQLISGASVGQEFAIANEGQARAIRAVPVEAREDVLLRAQEEAEARGKPVTAAIIKEVASGYSNEATQRPQGQERRQGSAQEACCHCPVHCP